MKKIVGLAILLISILIIYQVIVNNFKNGHEVTYSINNNSYVFKVNEVYDDGMYYFSINNNNYNFYITSNNYFNKVKGVIENIEYKYKDGLLCIYPKYKHNKNGMIWCSDSKEIYSYESIKDNNVVSEFINDLSMKGIKAIDNTLPIEENSDNFIYVKNYLEDDILVLWTYKGMQFFTNNNIYSNTILEFDRYDNSLSYLIGEYYITPKYIDNSLFEVDTFIVNNIKTNKNYELKLDFKLSNYSYINGVVDNKLYIFDKGTMSQIEINPYKKKIKVVGNKEKGVLYYNNGWETKNIYEYINNVITFSEIDESKISLKYNYDSIYESRNAYYLYSNGNMYRVYKNNLDRKILLFRKNDIRDIQIVNDSIYYVYQDKLYKYNDSYGIRKVVEYKELLYNSNKIIDVYGG